MRGNTARMRKARLGMAATLVAAAWWCTSPAQAQRTEGRVRIGLQTTLLHYETASSDDAGATVTASQTQYGVLPSEIGFDVGGGFGEYVVAGGQLTFGGGDATVDIDGDKTASSKSSAVRLV